MTKFVIIFSFSRKIKVTFKKKRHYPNSWKSEHCWPAIGPKVDKKIGSFNLYPISHLPSKQKWTKKLAIFISTQTLYLLTVSKWTKKLAIFVSTQTLYLLFL